MLNSNLNADGACIFGGVHPVRITWQGSRQQAASRASVDGCQEIVSTTPLPCYGVESTRLNPGMNTDPRLHTPYEGFDNGTNDDDGDDDRCKLNNEMFSAHLDQSPITTTLFPGIDSSASPAVVIAYMERLQAKDRHTLMICNTMLNIDVQLSF